MRKSSLMILIILVTGISAMAQESKDAANDEKCADRIYKNSEVTQRPKFGQREAPNLTPEAIAHGISGRVLLNAVLCSTGKVTDIKVIEGLPYGVTERAIEAARHAQFQPAELNGRKVSESIQFDYGFRYIGERRPLAKEPIAGRLIENLEVYVGKAPLEQVWNILQTRSGEPYSAGVVAADLRALLALGLFDPAKTSVRVEEGVRGGVKVVFDLIDKTP